jgi:hypothetical protein
MSVVSSAVDTVMVCFAESPNEFRSNYPLLSEQMVRAWRKTYPQEFLYAFVVEEDDAGGIYTTPPSQMQAVPLVPPPEASTVDKSDPLAFPHD